MSGQKLKRLGVVLLGAYVVSGCPSPSVSQLLANSPTASQEANAQTLVAQNPIDPASVDAGDRKAVDFEVCADVENWQRPSEADQAKRLDDNGRYGEALTSGSLKRSSTLFWDHQVISFTTYGLSARVEPENFSGVWTAIDEMASCYQPEQTVAINEGDRAETWLLNQRISDLQWEGDRYVMTVEPASTGLQVVHFDRVDTAANLPLEVVTNTGDNVTVVSGDWQP
jgi:hypothetical protein